MRPIDLFSNGFLSHTSFVYASQPLLVYWESTRACPLACSHCRAEAQAHRDPQELSTEEVKQLFRDIRSFHPSFPPKVVVTGGDPLLRPDLLELIAYGKNLGLDMAVTPAGSDLLSARSADPCSSEYHDHRGNSPGYTAGL
jgi:MoaA/NifB/PqqE/SkfB family radical SAM enzyme